jgi:GMP synthase-like glutamine amidotransferase
MQRVLILQHVWENPEGQIGTILRSYDIAHEVVCVETEPLPDPTAYAAIVAFGGTQHVYQEEKYPYFEREKALIRQAVEQNIPLLGICLGGQLLASALGAVVKQHSLTEIGFFDIPFTEAGKNDPLLQGLPGYQKVFHWHEDTFDLPASGVLLATNEYTDNQAFRYGRRAYGLQYHIEVTLEMLDTWLHHPDLQNDEFDERFIDTVTRIDREKYIHFPTYQKHTSRLFDNFLKISELI